MIASSFRYRLRGQLTLLVLEVIDQIGAARVVLAHVVVIDASLDKLPLDKLPLTDKRLDGSGRSVSPAKQWLPVDRAEETVCDLDAGVGPDHLQVEHRPTGTNRLDHVAQDVHDVLRLDSSE